LWAAADCAKELFDASLIGLIMLMGIATKELHPAGGIRHPAQRGREPGAMTRFDALMDACHKRARPIIMTTLAMGAGMMPIAVGWGGWARPTASFHRALAHGGGGDWRADHLHLPEPAGQLPLSKFEAARVHICRRTRFWPAVAKAEGFRLISGESELTQYLFNTKKNQHYFCRRCGVRPYGVGTETPIGVMYGVNLGCLEDVSDEELSRIPITYVDGRSDLFAPPVHFSHL
jgi:hypothetical protein